MIAPSRDAPAIKYQTAEEAIRLSAPVGGSSKGDLLGEQKETG